MFLCLVFLMLSCLFIAALWSPAGKGPALVGDVYCVFVTIPCGIRGQVWYLIVSFPDLCRFSYLYNINIHSGCSVCRSISTTAELGV